MARKAQKSKAALDQVQKAILSGIAKMWTSHGEEALAFAEESDEQAVVVTFKIEIDQSKSQPVVSVGIRFSKAITDSAGYTLDDPAQGTFKEITEPAEPEDE